MKKFSGYSVLTVLKAFFGIFMIVVYLGMAYLLFINYFDWDETPTWNLGRYTMAMVLALYGFYRCYRQVKGIDYYRLNDLNDEDEDEQEERVFKYYQKIQNVK